MLQIKVECLMLQIKVEKPKNTLVLIRIFV